MTLHTPETWRIHIYAGHGFVKGQGWSHPKLEGVSKAENSARLMKEIKEFNA